MHPLLLQLLAQMASAPQAAAAPVAAPPRRRRSNRQQMAVAAAGPSGSHIVGRKRVMVNVPHQPVRPNTMLAPSYGGRRIV